MALASVMSCDSQPDIPELLVISSSAEINGSLFTYAIVQKDCSVHVRGSVTGSLTIEPGADVLVDGSVYGKIINRGGRLVVNHRDVRRRLTHMNHANETVERPYRTLVSL